MIETRGKSDPEKEPGRPAVAAVAHRKEAVGRLERQPA
jgi:hypothetical protein